MIERGEKKILKRSVDQRHKTRNLSTDECRRRGSRPVHMQCINTGKQGKHNTFFIIKFV